MASPVNTKSETINDYIKVFVSDKATQDGLIDGLNNSILTIRSDLEQLERNLTNYVKTSDCSTKDEIEAKIKDVDSKLATASSGMVKFNNSASTYDFSILENNGLTDIVLNFDESYQGLVKFVKVNGTAYPVISSGKFNDDNNKIPNGSLIQIGYRDGGKLIITEPVWVEIETVGMGKQVNVAHSI